MRSLDPIPAARIRSWPATVVLFLAAALALVACERSAPEPIAVPRAEPAPAAVAEPNPLQVVTTAGVVEGFQHGEGIVAFRGIPFAAPPIGDLRWRAPEPPSPWEGVREATAFGPDCMQFPGGPLGAPREVAEDCLYLNVYKPASARAGDALPVHVYLYGGAFRVGSASLPQYENAGDVRDGIVYVNFNYRVGVFGFIAHPGLTAESPQGASGNYGLMDQVAALQWVRDNIAQFGGDPAQVTVSGVSAGACSIGYLLISPLNDGLFQRAVMHNTAAWHPQRSLAQQEEWAVAKFGADIAALRAMDAQALLAMTAGPDGARDDTDTLGDGRSGPFSYIDWMPIVDGYFLPKHDRQAWKDGDFRVVDLMIGDVENEGLMFMQFGPPIEFTRAAYEDYLRAEYGALGAEALAAYPVASDADVAYQLGLATGDTLFSLAAREMPRRMMAHTPNVYRYHFTKHTPQRPVALHGMESAYFFGNLAGDAFDDSDRALSEVMQQAKRRFIKTGDPNGDGLPAWLAYDASDPYMEFGDAGAVPGAGLRNAALDVAVRALDQKFPLD